MVFSLRLPKLSGGPAENPKKISEILKVLETPKIFAKILKFPEKRENANFVWRFRRILRSLRISFGPNG